MLAVSVNVNVNSEFEAALDRSVEVAPSRARRGPWLQIFRSTGWEWKTYTLPVPDLPPSLVGFKILHLSDFHCRPAWFKEYDELIARVNRANADLILYTGDLVEDKIRPQLSFDVVKRLVTPMKSRLGFFTVLGNHDLDVMRQSSKDEWGLTPIDQRRVLLNGPDGDTIELIGLAGLSRDDAERSFIKSLPAKVPCTLRVVLNHYPDGLRRAWSLAPDFYLCGHTHGGQICLPGGRILNRHDSLPERFIRGVNRIDNTWMSTTAGFGFSSALQVRTFCPAEAVELVLASE